MGWHADTRIDLEFTVEGAVEKIVADMNGAWFAPSEDRMLAENVGEADDETLTDTVWSTATWGKCWIDDDALDVLAKYAKGEIEVDASQSGDGWTLYVLDGDGGYAHYSGRIVYDGYPG
jgi:hypothetical protein